MEHIKISLKLIFLSAMVKGANSPIGYPWSYSILNYFILILINIILVTYVYIPIYIINPYSIYIIFVYTFPTAINIGISKLKGKS